MDFFALQLFAFLRPLLEIDSGTSFGGLKVFELGAIVFSGMLMLALLVRAALAGELRLSMIDLVIGAFVLWCIAIYLVYYQDAYIKELGKLVIPLLTYVVVKNVVANEREYKKLIWLVIVGFAVPTVASTVLIMLGQGIAYVHYWSGAARYQGVFNGPHNMAHDMTLLLMLIVMYWGLMTNSEEDVKRSFGAGRKILIGGLAVLALYCLYYSWVRTALLGFLVFLITLAIGRGKKLLVIAIVAAILAPALLVESLRQGYMYEVAQSERDKNFNASEIGGGRPMMWNTFINDFMAEPIDRQIAGVGIGFAAARLGGGEYNVKSTHNDFLDVLVQTGYVGFAIFVTLLMLILQRILRLDRKQRSFFLGFFAAIMIMNFVSNSYVSRFGLAQLAWLVLAYIEIPMRAGREGIHVLRRNVP